MSKLYIAPSQKLDLANAQDPLYVPLTSKCIQNLLLHALLGNTVVPYKSNWMKMKKRPGNVVFIIVEGIGFAELEAIKKCEKLNMLNANTDNKDSAIVAAPSPRKKIKMSNKEESLKEEVDGKRNYPQLLMDFFPKSSSQIPVHMEVCTSSLLNLDPVKDFIHMEISSALMSYFKRHNLSLHQKQNIRTLHTPPHSTSSSSSPLYSSPVTSQSRSPPFSSPSPSPTQSSTDLSSTNSSPSRLLEDNHEDKISRLDLILSVKEQENNNFPLLKIDKDLLDCGYRNLHACSKKVTATSPMFAIDCEMCITKEKNEVARISVIDEQLKIIYSSFVKPQNPVIDYVTRISGVRPSDLKYETTTLRDVQNKLRELLPRDAILVGHDLKHDFHGLKIQHPYVIDTSLIYNLSGQRHQRPSLKVLSRLFLGTDIQSKGSGKGHNPSEDAAASLQLVFLKLRNGMEFGDRCKGGSLPCSKEELKLVVDECRRAKEQVRYWRPCFKPRMNGYRRAPVIDKNLDIFKLMEMNNRPSTVSLVYTKECRSQFEFITTRENRYVECFEVDDRSALFPTTKNLVSQKQLVFCHYKICDANNDSTKKTSKRKLKRLDSSLKRLRDLLPNDTMLMTFFSGSHLSVPLEERGNGFIFLDLIGPVSEISYDFTNRWS